MQRRMILFVVLSVAAFVGTHYLSLMLYPPSKMAAQSMAAPDATVVPSPVSPSVKPHAAARVQAPASPQNEKTLQVDTDRAQVVLSNRGARILSWRVLAFKEKQGKSEAVDLVPESFSAQADARFGALELPGADLSTRLWSAGKLVQGADGTRSVTFSTTLADLGLRLAKTFEFKPGQYFVGLRLEATNLKSQALSVQDLSLQWGPDLGQPNPEDRYNVLGAVALTAQSIERLGPSGSDETRRYENPRWVAMKNHYFTVAMLPNAGPWTAALVERKANRTLSCGLAASFTLAPNASQTLAVEIYGGPQDYKLLKKTGYNLQKIVNFGWFWFLAIPMLDVLDWFFFVTRNYGWAIILLTILVRALVWYPTQKSMTSMRKMQKAMAHMQPRLDTLKKVHKDDPQKLNAEMMKLYKEYGVNPLGGCLPMLLQMPILFALYACLNNAFDLRGAPFLWVWTDLSAKDPTWILPVGMGVTMFIQQKMTPTTASSTPEQAQQQKMMQWMMPILLTGMAIYTGWPSGLLLYWMVSNLLSIVQQVTINRATA